MADKPDKPDVSQNARRVVRETTAPHEQPLPDDLEAAWEKWSSQIQQVDSRGMELLRAAFEVAWLAAFKSGIRAARRNGPPPAT